jgi:hypothetical protein
MKQEHWNWERPASYSLTEALEKDKAGIVREEAKNGVRE